MYESPIDIIYSEMQTKLEGKVFKAVQNVGINVNKDELIKALSYDRHQYEKGYADAKAEQQWIPVKKRKPTDWLFVLITDSDDVYMGYINTIGEWMDLSGNRLKDVIAWMPLPEPYKEE